MALHKDDLKEVRDFLFEIRLKWFNLGLEVGVKVEDLEEIKQNNKDFGDRLLEMLNKRLKFVEQLTWKTLAEALRAKAIDENQLAAEGNLIGIIVA